jgi:hypothetical protein
VIGQADWTITAKTVARGTSGHRHFNFIFSVISFEEVWVGRVTLPGTCRSGLHLAMAGKRLFWRGWGQDIQTINCQDLSTVLNPPRLLLMAGRCPGVPVWRSLSRWRRCALQLIPETTSLSSKVQQQSRGKYKP